MHRLVLLRHGESVWNMENRFTGWTDVDLTQRGVGEAKRAGETLDDFPVNRVGPAIARVVKEVIVSDDGNIATTAAVDVLRLAAWHGAARVTAIDPQP